MVNSEGISFAVICSFVVGVETITTTNVQLGNTLNNSIQDCETVALRRLLFLERSDRFVLIVKDVEDAMHSNQLK